MRAGQRQLLSLGLRLGLGYAATAYFVFYMKDDYEGRRICWFLPVFHLFISLPALFFSTDRQLDWYRRALFLPMSALWAFPLAGNALNSALAFWLGIWALVIVVPGAPLVWLVGAVWIWRRDRRRMRSVAC